MIKIETVSVGRKNVRLVNIDGVYFIPYNHFISVLDLPKRAAKVRELRNHCTMEILKAMKRCVDGEVICSPKTQSFTLLSVQDVANLYLTSDIVREFMENHFPNDVDLKPMRKRGRPMKARLDLSDNDYADDDDVVPPPQNDNALIAAVTAQIKDTMCAAFKSEYISTHAVEWEAKWIADNKGNLRIKLLEVLGLKE